jgi:hypothetical protein
MSCDGSHIKTLRHIQNNLEMALKERARMSFSLESLGSTIVRLRSDEAYAKTQVGTCQPCAAEWRVNGYR